MAKEKIEDLLNTPGILRTRFGDVEGTIKYGVRLPMRPGTTPLQECSPDSTEKIEGQKPGYWFVNEDQSVKVRLFTALVRGDIITGRGYDNKIFQYEIVRR